MPCIKKAKVLPIFKLAYCYLRVIRKMGCTTKITVFKLALRRAPIRTGGRRSAYFLQPFSNWRFGERPYVQADAVPPIFYSRFQTGTSTSARTYRRTPFCLFFAAVFKLALRRAPIRTGGRRSAYFLQPFFQWSNTFHNARILSRKFFI